MSTNAVFPDIGLAGWQALVSKALKGAPIDRLRTPTREGYVIEPLYHGVRDAVVVAPERGATPWGVIQRIDLPDATEANRQMLDDLTGGADGLDLVFSNSPHARGYGIAGADAATIERLFAGVDPSMISLSVDAGRRTSEIARRIVDVAAAAGIAASELRLATLIDPIGLAARNGGVADGGNKYAPVAQFRGGSHSLIFAADDDRDDGARYSRFAICDLRLKFSDTRPELFQPSFAFGGLNKPDRRGGRRRRCGNRRGAENEAAGAVDEVINQFTAAANVTAACAQRLAERAHLNFNLSADA